PTNTTLARTAPPWRWHQTSHGIVENSRLPLFVLTPRKGVWESGPENLNLTPSNCTKVAVQVASLSIGKVLEFNQTSGTGVGVLTGTRFGCVSQKWIRKCTFPLSPNLWCLVMIFQQAFSLLLLLW